MGWLAMVIAVMLLSARVVAQDPAPAPVLPQVPPPPLADVEATWAAFWSHISLGDVEGAMRYLHSSVRRHVDPSSGNRRQMQEAADQMAACRIDPVVSPLRIRKDEFFYMVRCRHGEETAESYLGMRRDTDGVWRISNL